MKFFLTLLSLCCSFTLLFSSDSVLPIMQEPSIQNPQKWELVTYFTYSPEELKALEGLSSEHKLLSTELQKWDYIAREAIDRDKIQFYSYTRIFTYLYAAQAEAASLSYSFKENLEGSFDPLCHKILALFIPHYSQPSFYITDAYSEALANLVFTKIKERVEKENAQPYEFTVPQKLQKDFSAGLEVAKWIPWFAKPSTQYWPPPPPKPDSPIWKEQINEIKKMQTPMTEAKKQIVYYWAGLSYPWSGDLRSIVNEYLHCNHIPLAKSLAVRSCFMEGLYDCLTAYVGCKYHYLAIRPQMYDPSIIYEITVPKHPSYPAGHSAESALSATILSFFFPESRDYWHQLAAQCSISRIWAGVHYPIDIEYGNVCGKKVGEKLISSFIEKQQNYDQTHFKPNTTS